MAEIPRRRDPQARPGALRPSPWVAIAAFAFCVYFALLVYCDVWRPQNPGFAADTAPDGSVVVSFVADGSAAQHAGIRVGDRILSFNHIRAAGTSSLDGLSTILETRVPMPVVLAREDTVLTVLLTVADMPFEYWRTQAGVILMVTLGAQLLTLLAGLFVLWRRPRDPVALTGAWFLLTCATFTIAFPNRMAMVWGSLPAPLGVLLWLPHASNLAIGAVLLTFVATFPRRLPHATAVLGATWTLAAAALAAPMFNMAHLVYGGTTLRAVGPGSALHSAVTVVSLGAAVAIFIYNYHRIDDINERRRLRAVLAGIAGPVLGAFPVVAFYWITGGHADLKASLFESPNLAFAAVAMLAAPMSITYAVLRHRLFDVSFIIRQGLRYALARWAALSVAPVLAAILAMDLLRHRTETIEAVLERRGAMYFAVAAAATAAYVWRQRWLDAIDRRFFRDRQAGYAVLREVAEHLRRGANLDGVAPLVVAKVEGAMHPRFAVLLARDPATSAYRTIAAAPAAAALPELRADAKLVALARVLEQPLETSQDAHGAEARHLNEADTDYVRRGGIDLIVPVIGSDGTLPALLVLGPKRSEEPYSKEDRDILVTISGNIALLAARSSLQPAVVPLEECSDCGGCFDRGTGQCANDGRPLTAKGLPRTLAGRYRLDRRLARGGMGTVYEAFDIALERKVAAKVVREDLARAEGAVDRFFEEGRIAARLVHPNVVTVYDFGVVEGRQPFLVMERLTGRTLRHEMEAGDSLPPDTILTILAGVCGAVDAAHRVRLVHRDLKPENIFLTMTKGSTVPKVLDFGVAKALLATDDPTTRSETRPGVMIGTPEYMAPEQLRGEPVSPGWDIWSLAVIAREMLGTFAVGGVTGSQSALMRVAPWEPGEVFRSRWPHGAQFFDRALALDRTQRPQDAPTFLVQLDQALRADGALGGSASAGRHEVMRTMWS